MNAATFSRCLPAVSASPAQRWCAPRTGRLVALGAALWVTEQGELDDHHLLPGQALAVRAGAVLWLGPWNDAAGTSAGWRFEAEDAAGKVAVVPERPPALLPNCQ